jgi:hypothetical protein
MKKPKPQRGKAMLRQSQPSPPQPPQAISPQQFLLTWWGKLLVLLALLGSIQTSLSTYTFFLSIYNDTVPDVHAVGSDKTPFVLPFIVKNNSHFLAMTGLTWSCYLDDVKADNGASISGITIETVDKPITIKPQGTEEFRCRIDIGKSPTTKIIPEINYKTLGLFRHYADKRFTWYGSADPPRWVESDAH